MFKLKRVANRGVIGVAMTALLAGAVWSGGRDVAPALASEAHAPSAAISTPRSTGFQIVNRGASPASVQVQFFDVTTGNQIAYSPTCVASGSPLCPSGTIAPGNGWLLDQSQDGQMGSSFAGGAIVLADQPLAGIVNEKYTNNLAYDAYIGVGNTEVATTIICPVVYRQAFNAGALYNSIVNVQGAGAATGSVTATFRDLQGNVVGGAGTPFNLAPGATKPLDLSDTTTIPGNPNLGAAFAGSVTLVGAQPIAAAVEQLITSGPPQLIDYTCFSSAGAGQTVYAPLLFNDQNPNGGNQRSSVSVANFGAVTANVQLHFFDATGAALPVVNDTIGASASKTYDQINTPANFSFGSLTVTADQNVALIVEEIRNDNAYGASYRGIPNSALSTNAITPLQLANIPNGGLFFSTSTSVFNPGVTNSVITMTFSQNGGGNVVINATIPAGKLVVFDARHGKCLLGLNIQPTNAGACTQSVSGAMDLLPNGAFGTMSVVVTSGPGVAVIVNEVGGTDAAASYNTGLGDTLLAYNGFP